MSPSSEKIRLVNPNLGHPQFLRVNLRKETQKIELTLLFASKIENKATLRASLEGNLSVVPILDYKWKLQRILEEERKKKQTLWGRIKKFFKKKSEEDKKIKEKLSGLEPRGYREEGIPLKIINIKTQNELNINDKAFLEDQYCSPQPYLQEWKIYDDLSHYFCIKISFDLPKEEQEYLMGKSFLMFDINYLFHETNYHSLVLTKQNWKNFMFAQITDLHLAERYDRIFEMVSKWKSSSADKAIGIYLTKIKDKVKSLIKSKSDEDKSEKQEQKMLKKPLKERFINPNNQLRRFIKRANKKVLFNELDFVVITGDIIDYVIKSRYSGMKIESDRVKFEHTNWKLFQDIILNKKKGKIYEGEVKETQELLCPLFSIVGNHDFRTHHYDLTWANLYKKLGLNSSEASALNELYSASPITSLNKSNLGLKFYLREINPSLDFFLSLGNKKLIFLNSGADSFKNLKDFLAGHPSLTGLSKDQVRFLNNIGKFQNSLQKDLVLLIHGPPINIGKYKYFRKRLQEIGKSKMRKKIGEFKESLLQKLGKEESDRRIDTSFNVKQGTVSSNWEDLIKFCKNQTVLTLSGHTHVLKEFRLAEAREKSTVYDAPPFILQKLQNPAAVFYDIYSERHDTPRKIQHNKPFIVQTPALGLGNYKKPKIVGAYREVKFTSGELSSFKVKFLE